MVIYHNLCYRCYRSVLKNYLSFHSTSSFAAFSLIFNAIIISDLLKNLLCFENYVKPYFVKVHYNSVPYI